MYCMQFATFARYLDKLEGISSRLEITAVLAQLFQELSPEETVQACYLLQGQLLPPYSSLEFQISVKTVAKALARLQPVTSTQQEGFFAEPDFSAAEKEVDESYRALGDLGLVAAKMIDEHRKSSVSILEVYGVLMDLAKDSGAQSQQRKLDALVDILKKADAVSAKFVIRIILGRMRLGFSDMTMIDALSWAMTGGKAERDYLELAYQRKADIGQLALFYLQQKDTEKRVAELQKYNVQIGIPVIPALCQRLNTAGEMIEKMQEVFAEPKYDGVRVQIHIDKELRFQDRQVKTFTRNLEETSHMFPELLEVINDLKCTTCILDAEAIGYNVESGDLLTFQETIKRKRKHDIAEKAKQIPVRFYVFDVLHIDGEDLLQKPLMERKEKLKKIFEGNSILYHSPVMQTTDPVNLHEYHEQLLAEGLEGVVVKQIYSPYQSGRKGWSWVKMKEAEGTAGKLADTLDGVVMGYYLGKGKRTEFGIGALLVGILDQEREKIVTISKMGTGLTDEVLVQSKQRCDALATPQQPPQYDVSKMLVPDVWCLPGFVVEVAADELTQSPLHSAEYALRFPRLVKFRDDKTWQQATTVKELEKLRR